MLSDDGVYFKMPEFFRNKKIYFLFVILLALLFSGDTIVLFIGHCLHVLFEFVASIVEHWLKATFHLSERQAQIVFFYLFATGFGFIAWQLCKKICFKINELCRKVHCQICLMINKINWFKVAAFMTAFSTFVFLLT